jgi:hypothetical protein
MVLSLFDRERASQLDCFEGIITSEESNPVRVPVEQLCCLCEPVLTDASRVRASSLNQSLLGSGAPLFVTSLAFG